MNELNKPIAWFDIESTGLNTSEDRIISLCIVSDGVKRKYVFNPLKRIDEEATKIHGFTNEIVKDFPLFESHMNDIFDMVDPAKYYWGGYNLVTYDAKLLINECRRYGLIIDSSAVRCIDPLKIWNTKEPRKLVNAYSKFCGKDLNNAHDAEADIMATIEIFEAMKEHYNITPLELSTNFLLKLETGYKYKIINNQVCFNFGKYKGRAVSDILLKDVGYVKWLYTQPDFGIEEKKMIRNEMDKLKKLKE